VAIASPDPRPLRYLDRRSPYLPIADYGAIGNLRTVALVGRDGSIDWCCLPELDSPSVFGAILDAGRAGRFAVTSTRGEPGEMRYREGTNVLETVHRDDAGRLEVTDFMPVSGELEGTDGVGEENAIHRLLRREGGAGMIEVLWEPRFDYARVPVEIDAAEGGWVARGGEDLLFLGGVPDHAEVEVVAGDNGPALHARFEMAGGSACALVTRWNDLRPATLGETDRMLAETERAWREWLGASHDLEWAGGRAPLVERAALAMKLLTFHKTGAIAAAATTSLPEEIGGIRNWDYRYAWIRDAGLTAQALLALGHRGDVRDFLHWAEESSVSEGEEEWGVRIMYGLRGETDLEEKELEHLEGYRGSRPVRIGNGAADQLQLDIYGELLDAAYELMRMGERLPDRVSHFLARSADRACRDWREPDAGIWEMRGPPRQFVYSKMMVWVALDRAVHLARKGVISGDADRWRRTSEEILHFTCENGFDPQLGAFTQSIGTPALDASNLLMPIHEFLPADDPRVQGTIDRTLEHLTADGLVYRYRCDDGLEGEEGAFGLCTFWLVDALALSGRLDEAWEIFDGMASRANSVGLFAEQVDPRNGELLGNFPQAFTHIGLVNSALYLAHAEGKELPIPAPLGTPEHRREVGHPVSVEEM
jgi:GH15 family glucan-1,4-alpha-glucosidase